MTTGKSLSFHSINLDLGGVPLYIGRVLGVPVIVIRKRMLFFYIIVFSLYFATTGLLHKMQSLDSSPMVAKEESKTLIK